VDEHEAARLANVTAYATRDVLHGSPHLNHASVWRIYTRQVSRALARVGPKPRVLDLGAGEGTALRPWLDGGAQVTAVDSSAEQLRLLREHHPGVEAVAADALDYLASKKAEFDIVSHVSMLHHIPDYLALLGASAAAVRPGGALLTFQDPLRYDTLPPGHYLAGQALYIPWRLSEGRVLTGIGNRIRRSRGVFRADNQDDQEEYHVQRNGVDSAAIATQLRTDFEQVEVESYFSSQARLAQWLGERLHLLSYFGVIASGRRPSTA
jgi:SAM-dependent methyltransferase